VLATLLGARIRFGTKPEFHSGLPRAHARANFMSVKFGIDRLLDPGCLNNSRQTHSFGRIGISHARSDAHSRCADCSE
jgi:hypothetical protein